MPDFGWTRLAYLLLVLTVLTVLARPGSPGTETRSLAVESPRGAISSTDARSSDAAETAGSIEMARRIEREISSLVDLGGVGGTPKAQSAGPVTRVPSPDAAPSGAHATTLPVFFRPPAAGRSSASAGPVCGDLGRFPASRRIVFPLDRRYFYSYEDTWGVPRPQGGHEGTDLMAAAGAPEYAVTDGTVVPVAGSNERGWNTLGGYAVMVRADYSIGPVKAGDLFYYAHLARRSPLEVGARVRAGQVVGYSGDTGQGPEVTRGLFPAHLHLGWYDATGARSEAGSGAMNPYPLLEWIKANGGAVTGGSGAHYCEAPNPVPSTSEGGWPAPDTPGVSPDLDTNSNDPEPSPAFRNEALTRIAPIRRAAPAQRATPERPARALQDRAPQGDPRAMPVRTSKTERTKPLIPAPPRTPETEPPATKPTRPESPKPGPPPRREPSVPEAPKPSRKHSASNAGASPSEEPQSPDLVREPLGVPWAEPALQDLPLRDWLEGLIPDLYREPAGTQNHIRPDEDRGEDKPQRGQDQQRPEQDHEEEPATNGPERRPPADDHEPAEDEPSLPRPETEDPDETDQTEPEITEPILETTVG